MRNTVVFLAFLSVLASASSTSAQIFSAPEPLRGVRHLALSPDGKSLAFSYRGDIWVVDSEGGRATPITNHIEMDWNPVWSPDGKAIAFASNRFGSTDIFVVPATGGKVQRVTYHSGSELPTDWPTANSILFSSRRDEGYSGLFSVDPATGELSRFLIDLFAVGNPKIKDGELLYTRIGFPDTRPRYQGSAASSLYLYNARSGESKPLRRNGFQHLWPNFDRDGNILAITVGAKTPSSRNVGTPAKKFTDNADLTPNVHAITKDGKAKRITQVVGGAGTRYLSVAKNTGDFVYEFEGDAFLSSAKKGVSKISITASIDDKFTQEERLRLTDGAQAGSLSPNGEQIVFQVRGELWVVPVKQGKGPNARDAEQLTSWEGVDANPIWNPNGKSFFFLSDREGAMKLYEMEIASKKITPISREGDDVQQVKLSPDKKSLNYVIDSGVDTLFAVDVDSATKSPRVVLKTQSIEDYSWSPDQRYLALQLDRQGISNIWLYETESKNLVNLTRRSVFCYGPSWSPNGQFLFFNVSGSASGMYIVPTSVGPSRSVDEELKYEKPSNPLKIDFDLTDVNRRIRRFSTHSPSNPIYVDPNDGDIFSIAEGDIWRSSYNGENLRRITSGGGIGSFQVNADGNEFFFVKNGALNQLNIRQPNAQPRVVNFQADWTRDLRKERKAALQEFYRTYNTRFYDENFHGRNWMEIRDRYMKLLDSVEHRNEMAILLNQMVGELEASHTEVGPGPGNPGGSQTASLGFGFDYGYSGPGLKITQVPARSPGSFTKTQLKVGEVVLEINGKPVSGASEALYRDILNDQLGRDLTLLVSTDGSRAEGKTRKVTYRALSGGEYSGLMFDNLLEDRRKLVEQRSGGKLTYVHIAGMGQGNFTAFIEEIWDAIQGKKGVIIDVRNNGGGNISDRLIDMIERIPNSLYQPRNGEIQFAPNQSWNLPTVVMMAESSFSNAEMFPSAMKSRRLAKTVGMPTPGYVIWTFEGRLIDGTSIRIPTAGSYRLDGSPLENNGERPDYEVDITPKQFFSGKDPQLEKAIDVLMREIR